VIGFDKKKEKTFYKAVGKERRLYRGRGVWGGEKRWIKRP